MTPPRDKQKNPKSETVTYYGRLWGVDADGTCRFYICETNDGDMDAVWSMPFESEPKPQYECLAAFVKGLCESDVVANVCDRLNAEFLGGARYWTREPSFSGMSRVPAGPSTGLG